MTTSLPPRPTITTADLLCRDAAARSDAALLTRLADEAATHHLVVLDGRALIRSNAARSAATILWLDAASLARIAPPQADKLSIYLGRDPEDGTARFALILSNLGAEPLSLAALPPHAALVDLRALAMQGVMSAGEMSLVGEALMLANWHDGARYCGRCGSPTTVIDGGWKRACPACARDLFPRIDPVVIMLVTDGTARAVVSREPRFPPGMVSTLAGFIEPGEDIEHAVRRETQEEIGLEVAHVRFVATQPWPFPHSLMIGCIAGAVSHELKPDPAEIEFARWVTPEEARAMLEKRHAGGLWLPGAQSLANLLVRTWLADVARGGAE